MTASLQTYARQHMEAIDNLSFQYEILSAAPDEITEAPADGVIVFGMYLEVRHPLYLSHILPSHYHLLYIQPP